MEREELRVRGGVRVIDMVYSVFWVEDRYDFDKGLIHEHFPKVIMIFPITIRHDITTTFIYPHVSYKKNLRLLMFDFRK